MKRFESQQKMPRIAANISEALIKLSFFVCLAVFHVVTCSSRPLCCFSLCRSQQGWFGRCFCWHSLCILQCELGNIGGAMNRARDEGRHKNGKNSPDQ